MKTLKAIIQTKEYQQFKRFILGYLYELVKLKLYNLFHSEKSSIIDVVDDRDIMYEEIEVVM